VSSDEDIAGRVHSALAALAVDAEELPCDPALADTAAFCAHYGVDPEDSANCIVVAATRGERRHCVCLVLATTRLDVNGAVRRLTGWPKASFAGPEETVELTGMLVGGVTPFGLPAGLPVFVDAAVMRRDRVVVGGGDRSRKLRIDPDSLLRVPGALVVDGLAVAAAPRA
jgi:prolyl-tRNA editing enzyme YbaK/EbsC (Cys-tRNA(Pro) deacylase)